MKNTLIAAFAGLALLAAGNVWAQSSRVSSQFQGPEVKSGTVTFSMPRAAGGGNLGNAGSGSK